jgi:hypothetical protein
MCMLCHMPYKYVLNPTSYLLCIGKSNSSTASKHAAAQLEKIAAAAVYSPVSKWVGKLLASLLRAEGACMLHVTPHTKVKHLLNPLLLYETHLLNPMKHIDSLKC